MSEWLLRGNEMENEKGERLCPTLLKIDVEGMEESILRGSTRIIQTCQPILYVENNCIRDSPGILKLLLNEFKYENEFFFFLNFCVLKIFLLYQ